VEPQTPAVLTGGAGDYPCRNKAGPGNLHAVSDMLYRMAICKKSSEVNNPEDMAKNICETDIRAMLSRNLKRLRAKKNLSQLHLALEAGLTHNFINDIESGKKWLSPKTLAALAAALDSKPYEFFAPEVTLPKQDLAVLSGYLDNFACDIQRWVDDLKGRYLQGINENKRTSTS
jgi:transcriptional regulator with XRE-family HTH domain